MNVYRANSNELNYFGSDLNKFINEYCSKEMTAINIDLLIYKRSRNSLRIIESKHENENIPRSQMEVLKVLSGLSLPGLQYGVYIIVGNFPYNTSTITNIATGEIRIVDNQELISFLEFRG